MTTKLKTDYTTAYARSVVDGRQPACRYIRLACERHLKDLERDDYWFDAKAAQRFFNYSARFLKHYKGPQRGEPLVLEPWQHFFFGCVYGWKCVRDGERTDLWRFNINYCEVPRKNGKTTGCAAGASYDCAFVEETGAEVYCLATKEDQAKLVYNDVAAYIAKSPELADTFEILKGKNTIYSLESSRTSFIRPLGADSQRLDGLNPLAAYADELHAWPDRDLWDVMLEAFGARNMWHIIAITTAGHNRLGICYEQREHLINVLEGRIVDDNFFGVIYTVDDEQREHWTDPKNWYIANPNLGHGKHLEYMEQRALQAKQMPTSLNTFLNKQLNIWTDVAEAWLNVDQWNAAGACYTLDTLRNKRCTAAFDLARVGDLSAVAYAFGRQAGLEQLHLLVDFYLPANLLRERSQRDRVDYALWAKQGWLTLTPGNTTDYDFIREDINKRAETVKVERVMYDRHFAGELVTHLTKDGFKLEPVGMGFISLGSPTAELERLLVAGQLRHNQNPILTWNAANVVVSRDAVHNMKPDKDLSTKRIDGIMAVVMALADVIKHNIRSSKYESKDLLIF